MRRTPCRFGQPAVDRSAAVLHWSAINTAADDAAGYAIVQGITSQVNGLNQAAQNANDGVSLTQTASGALQEITNDLQTMRDLAVESLNVTNSGTDRTDLNQQFAQLQADIDHVAKTTQFNGVNLLDGTFQGSFQIGANVGQTDHGVLDRQRAYLGAGRLHRPEPEQPRGRRDRCLSIIVGGSAYSLGTVTGDAADVTAAINNSGVSGLTATVNSNSSAAGTGAQTAGAATNVDSITINGIAVYVTNTGVPRTTLPMPSPPSMPSPPIPASSPVNGSGGITLTCGQRRQHHDGLHTGPPAATLPRSWPTTA